MNEKAFPIYFRQKVCHLNGETEITDFHEEGMDLRDYFAAKASVALIRNAFDRGTKQTKEETIASITKDAFEFADAMMEARKR